MAMAGHILMNFGTKLLATQKWISESPQVDTKSTATSTSTFAQKVASQQ